jgi:predicted nucleotidyltransferase
LALFAAKNIFGCGKDALYNGTRSACMKQIDYEIAKKLKKRLSEVVSIVDFKVFGSRARGDDGEFSDMDVFVEVESLDKELKNKIYEIAWEVGFEHFIVISPLLFTRYEIEESPMRVSPIVKNIAEEGVAV